ncbi:uncharacterized protein HD556DRAFT_1310613 [Suillus plorans]|uniref:Uncharacterized protein n=1 Tax=Suillus plorans TaxID=116603 RepID=A0A9P7DFE9_9AGAM|nr:uncharacterized protein HD556DRAFT_1310613 [Suillus plorans]KAG1790401.1 hypothetical protein HD556DRAFT_1310613 [Suillus plorans]
MCASRALIVQTDTPSRSVPPATPSHSLYSLSPALSRHLLLLTLGVQLFSPALGIRLFTMGLQILTHRVPSFFVVDPTYHPSSLGIICLIVQARCACCQHEDKRFDVAVVVYVALPRISEKARCQRACSTYSVISRYHVLKSVLTSGHRTVELANGWAGLVITTESCFDYLNGAIVTLDTYALSLFHLGVLVKKENDSRSTASH